MLVRLLGVGPVAVELITLAAYARHRGCDEKAVRKAIAEGRITAIERDGRKWIDRDVADIQWARNTRARAGAGAGAAAGRKADGAAAPVLPGPGSAEAAAGGAGGAAPDGGGLDFEVGDGIDYQEAARRLKVEEARLARMERLEREGKLTDAEAAGRAIWTAFRALRDTAMPLGRRVAGRVAAMDDAREIQMLIEAEMRQVLQAFRDRMLMPVVREHAPLSVGDAPAVEEG